MSENGSEKHACAPQQSGEGMRHPVSHDEPGEGDARSHGPAIVFPQPDRLRLQRRVSALLGLVALIVGYGVAVTIVLTLF